MATLANILIIDGEVRSQEALRRTLAEEFNVLTVSSALEGYAVMEREVVQVILCDQRMPEMALVLPAMENWLKGTSINPHHYCADYLELLPARCCRPTRRTGMRLGRCIGRRRNTHCRAACGTLF